MLLVFCVESITFEKVVHLDAVRTQTTTVVVKSSAELIANGVLRI